MSAEFEKIVLEKFDELNSKINGLSEELHETKENIQSISKKVDMLEEKVDNNTNSISNLSVKIDNLEEKININTNSIYSLSKKIDINTDLIASLSKQVEQQSLNLASFENEFTIKIQALFDSFVSNTQSHLSYEKSISVLHAKTFKHDDRISVLEDYFKNAKFLASN